jgi:peptidoglycan/LPS O-acetylase OafA/YrhL
LRPARKRGEAIQNQTPQTGKRRLSIRRPFAVRREASHEHVPMNDVQPTTTKTPDQDPFHRANNFDTLRIIAAMAVVLAHGIPLSYGPATLDILWPFSRHQATFGYVAIQFFFVISGYLITGSYQNTKNARRFIRARVLRLVPALIPLFVVLAFILGPLVTAVPLAVYARALPYPFLFGLTDHLPGVFSHNPFSDGIDGSLWTLRYEVLYYAIVCGLGVTRLLNRTAVTILYVVLLAARLHYGPHASTDLGTLFFAGALLKLWAPPFGLTFAAPFAILWGISLAFSGYPLISDTFGAYVILCLGLEPNFQLPNLAKYGDLSYGVYIFAWPIQQAITLMLGQHANWIINSIITVPLVLFLAWLSWHYIESPALHLKNRKLLGIL